MPADAAILCSAPGHIRDQSAIIVHLYIESLAVHSEPSHKTRATEPPAKKAHTGSKKAPASAPEKRKALGCADENTSAPGEAPGRPGMDPATEVKKLRQLCTLLRAELAAQQSKVALMPTGSSAQSPFECSHSVKCM